MSNILIVGMGVIGSIYAVLLKEAGYNVKVYARNNRLQELKEKGLVYLDAKTKKTKKVDIDVIDNIEDDVDYGYIFLTVRYDQVEEALYLVKDNISKNIVTMVNNPGGYSNWEKIVGGGRIIPAFPGAGGKMENGVLKFSLTNRMVQPTTLGELDGYQSERIIQLTKILRNSGFPTTICNNMDSWQKTHLALVIPMANAIYFDGGNNYTVSKNGKALMLMSKSLKGNFNFISKSEIGITPFKFYIIKILPMWFLRVILKCFFNTRFAEKLVNDHAKKARYEMELLSEGFNSLANKKGFKLKYLKLGNH